MLRNKILIYFLIVVLGVIGAHYLANVIVEHESLPSPDNKYKPMASDTIESDHVLLNVPFTSQAPLGHWEDLRQEDGCEEASLIMAWLWINNQTLSPQEAEKGITDMSDFELSKYGDYHDFDAEDTAQLMKDYYNYDKLDVKINPSIDDIKNELRKQKVVLVPSNGQLLNNPHYKQPGPLTHMLVIKGFDESKQEFITNDPGTKYGEGYTYSYETVYKAMVDYPTGNHGSQEGRPKAMISISK